MIGKRSSQLYQPSRPRTRSLYFERDPTGGRGGHLDSRGIGHGVSLNQCAVPALVRARGKLDVKLNMLLLVRSEVKVRGADVEPTDGCVRGVFTLEVGNDHLIVALFIAHIAYRECRQTVPAARRQTLVHGDVSNIDGDTPIRSRRRTERRREQGEDKATDERDAGNRRGQCVGPTGPPLSRRCSSWLEVPHHRCRSMACRSRT